VQIFEPRVKANPNDAELAKKVLALLGASKCNTLPLYKAVGITVFSKEPTAQLAYDLARIFANGKEFKSAEKYYQEAIRLQADSVRKSAYLVEYASIVWREFNNVQQARNLAMQAISVNPGLGQAYMLIGNLYASEKSCGSEDFDKKTVFWAAVDKFIKAKQVDPNLAGDCDKLIDLYTQYFPAQSEIFFQDLQPGASYTVGCWINERTTIRARQQ
jgi:tetratricopeptide (TPR) repeat protein